MTTVRLKTATISTTKLSRRACSTNKSCALQSMHCDVRKKIIVATVSRRATVNHDWISKHFSVHDLKTILRKKYFLWELSSTEMNILWAFSREPTLQNDWWFSRKTAASCLRLDSFFGVQSYIGHVYPGSYSKVVLKDSILEANFVPLMSRQRRSLGWSHMRIQPFQTIIMSRYFSDFLLRFLYEFW